ncbi:MULTISPECIES: enoyl-CoA hydratase/isomerase family protein [unclassified Sphingobium]|uniref:enoyl-CoA hydratase/isomerase family protein n=1 Tax=unclassified Sphingobium TaxID=2611147 RepID=UPI0035A654A2
MNEPVDLAISDYVATVTLNVPPVNAQTAAMMDALIACFDRISDDPAVRCVILTGAGKVFSAGADLKSRVKGNPEPGAQWAHLRRVRETFYAVMECRKPVIAAVNGPALGAGLALVASCDILLVSETASFGLPEINVGLMGGARHALRLFGHSLARRMVLTGYRVPGPELLQRGIVEDCLPPDQLMPAARAMAADIASKSPHAIRLAKRTLGSIENLSLRDGYRFEQNMTAEYSKHPDSRESMLGFIEKREERHFEE